MKICPYCRGPALEEEGNVIYCNGCGTPHHQECYDENGGCTLFGCVKAPADEPKIQVSSNDMLRAPMAGAGMPPVFTAVPTSRPTGFGDASVSIAPPLRSAQPAAMSVAPPPPRVSAAPPPPPPLGTLPPVSVRTTTTTGIAPPLVSSGAAPLAPITVPVTIPASTTSGQATAQPALSYLPSSGMLSQAATASVQPKNRLTFILLGIFLGIFGAHNFYAGYWKRGVGQLCVTVLTLFYGSFISFVWAIVEVCTVEHDSKSTPFS